MRTQVIIIALLVAVLGIQAEANNRSKGPHAKNAKAWNRSIEFYQPVVEEVKLEQLVGPELKNVSSAERLSVVERSADNTVEVIIGPKAKNQRPF